mgnify:CR=1 FL=1
MLQRLLASLLFAASFLAGGALARPFTTPVIDGSRAVVHPTFYAPGAPRTAWIGVSYTFGGAGG